MVKSETTPAAPPEEAVESCGALTEVEKTMVGRFPDAPDRLAQLTFHLATARMVIEHLYDEEPRHREHAERLAARAALGL